ncbi:hypothetical protein [Methanolobus sp.]|uniref:hypothetical protein n=1 Tax=Methanolobus sp. TaxID=1874737 RepID=UPI0035216586
MKQPLLDVVLISDKRTKVLLISKDGPQEMQYFLSSLNTTRQTLLPQIRVLEDHHLVNHYRDTYELTTIGKPVVGEMAPLLDTTNTVFTHCR